MTSTTEQTLPPDISIFVCEEVKVMEACWACLLILTADGFHFGYLYTGPEEFEDNLPRAYDMLFEETLKRLESKGIHLRL